MSDEPLLELRGVTKTFPAPNAGFPPVAAIQNCSLRVRRNELLAVVGPSGSGKSTLINLIAGFCFPTAGDIVCDGERVVSPGPDRLVVFQDHAVFPWFTALQNVEYGLACRAIPPRRRRERSLAMLHAMGLAKFADAYPQTLSGGMRQRIALARVLVMRPKALLLDEPFAALDAATRNRLQDELLELWQSIGVTIVFVTHSPGEAAYIADRIVVLDPPPRSLSADIVNQLPRPRKRRSSELYNLEQTITGCIHTSIKQMGRP